MDIDVDEIHVWSAALDPGASRMELLMASLSAGERARADRFHFDRDRDAFVAARGTLRAILGCYLRCDPRVVAITSPPQGKPELGGNPGTDGLRFNLSHSGTRAVYAVTRGREVGIDVERVRPFCREDDVSGQFLSRWEARQLDGLDDDARQRAVLTYWTCKEAYVKAIGRGLTVELTGVEVAFKAGEPAGLQFWDRETSQTSAWCLRALDLGDEYVGALVVQGSSWRLGCGEWRWQL
jgi:4'-phosphopantetheinyl transferase